MNMDKFNIKKIFLSLIISVFTLGLYAQNSATVGKEFHVIFGRNYESSNTCQIRYVVTETSRISLQYGDGTYLDNNVEYQPGIYTKNLDKTKCYTTVIQGKNSYAIKITSTKDIGVFALNLQANTTDGTTVLPLSALGTNYTIISHTHGSYQAFIGVTATENGTSFKIKDKNGSIVVNDNLTKGQTYFHSAANGVDLSGFTVESNLKIAVFSYNVCGAAAACGACDHNFEQMWPSDTAGKRFFLWNLSYNNCQDLIKILALEDGTVITKKEGNTVSEINLNKYNLSTFKLNANVLVNNSTAPVWLESNKPIIVANILGFAPCIKWISPVEQTITEAAISPFVPQGSSVLARHDLDIMIPAGTYNNLSITETEAGITKDVKSTFTFYTNLSNPDYIIARKYYDKTSQVLIEIKNPGGFISYITGTGASESYVFTAGAGAFNLQAYFTIGTKTNPYKDTYYSATSTITHSFEETDNITLKRTIEKSFSTVKWLLNGNLYSGITENNSTTNTLSLPASALRVGENSLTMSVRYTGTSQDSIYEGKVWLAGITDYPDNISENLICVKEADATVWGIGEVLPINITDRVHNYAPLVVGDIDNDGKVEIIGLTEKAGNQLSYDSDGIIIYNFEDGKVKKKHSFSIIGTQNGIAGSTSSSFGSIAIARYNNEGYIVLAGTNTYLYAYKPDGQLHWRSDQPCSNTIPNIVNIADFNGDGIPEVYVGNKIFSLSNGKLLCDGGSSNNKGIMSNSTGYSPMAIDITLDGKLNLIAGTQIYDVTITNNNGTSGNSISPIAGLELPASKVPANSSKDGMTQVVDIDNDGQLEVVVTTLVGGRVVTYVWKPLPNGESILMGSYLVPATGIGYNCIPMIGDIDNDGYPEIVYITNGSTFQMYALQYTPGAAMGNRLSLKWQLSHTDGSGCTGMSLFDFNLDGTAEIVYRDERTLRIIDGSGSTAVVKKTFDNVRSATLREYPIVADIDNDGQAEIIIQGYDEVSAGGDSQRGYIRVFKSSGTQWAPARTVWNQYNYNSVNVNEDLTIPAKQFPITTKFKGKDKTAGTADDVRVYNNFRQQQTYLDKNGVAFMKIANAVVENPQDIKYDYNAVTDVLTISGLKVRNDGEATLKAPFMITTYKDNVSPSSKKITYSHTQSIGIGDTEPISFTIPSFKSWMPVNKLIIKVNDAGSGINHQEVCDSCCVDNESLSFANISFDNVAWADSYRKCEGDEVQFQAKTLPGTGVVYNWFKPDGAPQFTSIQNPKLTSLTNSHGGEYIFKAEKVNGDLSLTYKLPYLSVAPKIMYWKQQPVDDNWNNMDNWAKDINGTPLSVKAVPAPCTTVHLPGGATRYPSLNANTITTLYGQPEVDNIVFHYKSELIYQHKLKYNKAFVQYNFGYYNGNLGGALANADNSASAQLDRDKWYVLAAPLKKMAVGDFALAGYPFTWQANYQVASSGSGLQVAQGNSYESNGGNLLDTYNAIGVKVAGYNSAKTGYNDHKYLENLKGIIEIPYFENSNIGQYRPGHTYDRFSGKSTFYYYNTKTLQAIHSPVGKLERGEEAYRFIYENASKQVDNINAPDGSVPGYALTVKAPQGSGNKVLIGNPLLASINTKNFLNANTHAIAAGTQYWVYNASTQTWNPMNYDENNNINSFQAFIITLKGEGNYTLYFPFEGTYALTKPGQVGNVPFSIGRALAVQLEDIEGNGDKAMLSSPLYSDMTRSVEKIVSASEQSVPEVFFIDKNQKEYNLLQLYNSGTSEINLGVKAPATNQQLTLNFANADEFAADNNVGLTLVDKVTGTMQDLTKNSTYSFVHKGNPSDGQYIDTERFVVKFNNGALTTERDEEAIRIYYNTNAIHIEGMDVDYANVFDIAGNKVYEWRESSISYVSLNQGAYIVRAFAKDGKQKVARIMVK